MQRHSPFVPTPCATAGCHCGGWGWEEGPRALGLGVSFPHPELEVRGWSGFSGLGRREQDDAIFPLRISTDQLQ